MHEFKVGDIVEPLYVYTNEGDWSFKYFWQRDDGRKGIKYYGKVLEIKGSFFTLELHLPDGSLYYPKDRTPDYENALWCFSSNHIRFRGVSVSNELFSSVDDNSLIPDELLRESV